MTSYYSLLTFISQFELWKVTCWYLTAPGLVLLVLSADLCCSALQRFQLDVAGYFGYKCTADIPLWLLTQQEVAENTGGVIHSSKYR